MKRRMSEEENNQLDTAVRACLVFVEKNTRMLNKWKFDPKR